MNYDPKYLILSDGLCHGVGYYAMILLKASRLQIGIGSVRCYLDGCFLLCLNERDTLTVYRGRYDAMSLQFHPYFYNVNLSHTIIGDTRYPDMMDRYGYPDFHLFIERNEEHFGLLSLGEDEYVLLQTQFGMMRHYIGAWEQDGLWSCRTRSAMISVLRIAEAVYQGEQVSTQDESDSEEQWISRILRYVQEHVGEELSLQTLSTRFHTNRTTLNRIIRNRTGMSTAQYIRTERLNQSKPDLLFTRLSIEEIAARYGFSDPAYYHKVFKAHFGMGPREFREIGFAKRIMEEDSWHFEGDGRLEMGKEAIAAREEMGLEAIPSKGE